MARWIRSESFSTAWDGYDSAAAAKAARDARYRELKRQGYAVKRSILRNQLRKYSGLGQPDGSVCDVYRIDVYYEDAAGGAVR